MPDDIEDIDPNLDGSEGVDESEEAEEAIREAVDPTPFEVEIPLRMLHVVGVAAKESTRYAMDGLLIETMQSDGLVAAVATDGRRMIVAESNIGMFDTPMRRVVPGAVARGAVKLGKARTSDNEPMATIHGQALECKMTVYTPDGPVIFNWIDAEHAFPPYREIIPDWSASGGVARINVNGELVSGALKTLAKVLGDAEPSTMIYLPSAADKPLGFEAQEGDALKVLAIVMPKSVEGWTGQKVKGEAKKDVPPETVAAKVGEAMKDQSPLSDDPVILKAARDLCLDGKHVTSVTISSGGESVTLDSNTRKTIDAKLRKMQAAK